MKIEIIKIEELKPYQYNAKLHPKEHIEQIANSIKEFGNNDPIAIDENNTIIEGHGRLEALKKLGYKEVEVIRLNHLTEEQKRAYIIAHNKLTMNTGFDLETLHQELSLLDVEFQKLTGFTETQISELEDSFRKIEELEEDEVPEAPKEPYSKIGDLWILDNKHKIYCGDSTDEKPYQAMLGKEQADMVMTDPPYNVDYGSKAEAINPYGYQFNDRRIENDYMPTKEFVALLEKAFGNFKNNLKSGGVFYIWYASISVYEFETALRLNALKSRQELIWNKNAIVLSRQDYQWKHEPCLYGWKEGAAHYFVDDRTYQTVINEHDINFAKLKLKEAKEIIKQLLETGFATTIINEDKPIKSPEHPTMKPIKLLARLIRNSSRKNELVLDPFLGSGSTLIASDILDRRCYGIELDPKYVDVIIKRYIQHKIKNNEDYNIILIRDNKEINIKDTTILD